MGHYRTGMRILLIAIVIACIANLFYQLHYRFFDGRREHGHRITEENLQEWIGEYRFFEFCEPNINRAYSIQIGEVDGNYIAHITVNGFQTQMDINASIAATSEGIALLYQNAAENNMDTQFGPGSILIELRYDNKLWTKFVKLHPFFLEEDCWVTAFEKCDSFSPADV